MKLWEIESIVLELTHPRFSGLLEICVLNSLRPNVSDLDSVEKRLNTTYQQVKAILSPEQQKDLVASEREWIAFKGAAAARPGQRVMHSCGRY